MRTNEILNSIATAAHALFYEDEAFDTVDEAMVQAAQDLILVARLAMVNAWDSGDEEEYYENHDIYLLAGRVIAEKEYRDIVFRMMINE